MNWNKWVRQIHRWLSIFFTVLVIANIVVNIIPSIQEELILGLGYFTILPILLLMITGLYLFVLPYTARRRSGQGAD